MNGETVFRALVAVDVVDVARSLNAVDKGQMALAFMEEKWKVLPKKVRALCEALAVELDK